MRLPLSLKEVRDNSQEVLFRPVRVAVIHGSPTDRSKSTQREFHNELELLFSRLSIDVFSQKELREYTKEATVTSDYDIIAVLGRPEEFQSAFRPNDSRDSIVLSFAASDQVTRVRQYLAYSDAIILCKVPQRNWMFEISQIVRQFLESLIVPSMLNVDLADLKRIAKGVGITAAISDDDHRTIIARLPSECLIAKSALLHFACKEDVSLREVYSISRAFATKREYAGGVTPIVTPNEAKKIIRKINVKMGIRIIDSVRANVESLNNANRINLTAIFFGM